MNLLADIVIRPEIKRKLYQRVLKSKEQVWVFLCSSTINPIVITDVIEGKNEAPKPRMDFHISGRQLDDLTAGKYGCILVHSHYHKNHLSNPSHEDIEQLPVHRKLIGGCVFHPIKQTLAFYNKGQSYCKIIEI